MTHSVIDWELATTLAGNSREFAKDMFLRLVKQLPDEILKIKHQYHIYDLAALEHSLHQLHGALSYCGAPRLKTAIAEFEQAVMHKKYLHLDALLADFELEANLLINQVSSPAF